MRLGSKKLIVLIYFSIFFNISSIAEDKILSSPLINLNELKPSFEEVEETVTNKIDNEAIKNKKKSSQQNNVSSAKFIGLDKITAKTSEIVVKLGETQKFGPLEIKVLKCGKLYSENINENVAYLQVKDLSKNENEKVFIFNGWTFSSDPNLAPFDHAIYDLQLVNCNKV